MTTVDILSPEPENEGSSAQRRYEQTEKGKISAERYHKSPAGKAARRRYEQSELGKLAILRYQRGKRTQQRQLFQEVQKFLKDNPDITLDQVWEMINETNSTNGSSEENENSEGPRDAN